VRGHADLVLRLVLPAAERESVRGDLEEVYADRLREKGRMRAGFWYWGQVFKVSGNALGLSLYWSGIMFKNYLKIAFRNLNKQKIYSFTNLAGLAIGLAVTMVITLYIMDDLSFDRFHKDADRIYRILSIGVKRGTKNSITSGPVVRAVKESVPEVESATRVSSWGDIPIGPAGTDLRDPANQTFTARSLFADSRFFDVFSFKIIEGAGGDALARPESVFLTPEKARALFHGRDPVGQPLAVAGMRNAQVAGLVEAPPPNSHLQFDIILPLIPEQRPENWDNWENLNLSGYVRLKKGADPAAAVAKMKALLKGTKFPEIFEPRLQPLADIHLGSSNHFYDYLNTGRSDRTVFFTMVFVGILVLLVACVNFINLTTSRASRRALEVGLRKVVGSSRAQLVGQFMGESALLTFIGFLGALALAILTLPALNAIMKKSLTLSPLPDAPLILIFLAVSITIGLLSGIYPSLILSSFRPAGVLKGEFRTDKKGVFFRRALVVFQFACSTVLLIAVFIVVSQIRYLKALDLGYDRSQVLAVFNPIRGEDDVMKQKLATFPEIVSVGRMDSLPSPDFTRWEIFPEGFDRKDNFTAARYSIDEDIFTTLNILISAGRGFSKEFPAEAKDGIVVNEMMIRKAGYKDPVGKTLRYVDDDGRITPARIIGIIRDFHYQTVRQKPEPMIFFLNPRQSGFLMVRIAPGKTAQALALIEQEYKKLFPGRPFRSQFLDETFDLQFNRDRDFMRNIGLFAGLAVFVACLGLIGLAAYAIEQRRREIAIRKILGCRGKTAYGILVAEFAKWVFLANLVAWPAAYLATGEWLKNFVFRVPFKPWPFLLASAATLLIALLTISFQTLRAVRTNPVNSLRENG